MTMRIKIEITQEDINGATRKDSCNCPVARSLRRHGFDEAEVWLPTFDLGPEYIHKERALPRMVYDMAAKWDSGGEFEPCEFYLYFPDFT